MRAAPIVLVLAALGCSSGERGSSEAPPSVQRAILITLDTLRADHTSPYGASGRVSTPALLKLAGQSLQFNRAYTSMPTTGPAHLSILTGLYPQQHGGFENGQPARPGVANIAGLARDHGWRTAAFVSARHLNRDGVGISGFESWDAPDTVRDGEATVALAMQWVHEHRLEPFFLWIHLYDPHWPYVAHGSLSTELARDLASLSDVPTRAHGGFLDAPMRADEQRKTELLYDAEIEYTDAQIGRFLDLLEREGLAASSLLVVTSDHGEILGEAQETLHYAFDHGEFLLPGELRVPLWIRMPGLRGGRTFDEVVETRALCGTILRASGIQAPAALPVIEAVFSGRHTSRRSPSVSREREGAGREGEVTGRGVSDYETEPAGQTIADGGAEPALAFVSRRRFEGESVPAIVRGQRFAVAMNDYLAVRIEGDGRTRFQLFDAEGRERSPSAGLPADRDAVRLCDQAIKRWLLTLGTGQNPAHPPEMDEEMRRHLKSLGYVH